MTRKQHRSRGAYASEFCLRRRTKNRFAPGTRMIPKSGVRFSDKIMRRKEGGEARKAHANHSAPHQQTSPFADASGAAARQFGARPPSGATPRLSQGLPSLLNSRPCFLGPGIKRALPALSRPSPVTAPHASAVVPKGLMPEAAPARIANPRGSTALAPHSDRIRNASLDERDSAL
jgi:hypothetical protein